MGQAKQRGKFEQRQFLAKAKRLKDGIDAMRRAREKEAAMTPAQRANRTKMQTMLAIAFGMSANEQGQEPPASGRSPAP